MNEREVVLERIQKKSMEIQALEERLRAAKVYLQALKDILTVFDGEPSDGNGEPALRPGSAMALAQQAILNAKTPLHIDDLLKAIGKTVNQKDRASLASSLSAYVRSEEIFTRPAPNTFGLIELGHTRQKPTDEPPADFGQMLEFIPDQPESK